MRTYAPRRAEFVASPSEVMRPIFGLDIDGSLGAYHEHFWSFAVAWTGRNLPHPSEFRGDTSFATFLGLSKATYRKIKLAYRRGGLKRSMPAFDGASLLTRVLRDRGAIVVLCTTRPYLSLEGVDEDTRHWARRNSISHDFIIWGEWKYRDLARFGDRVVAIMDDEPLLLAQAKDAGLYTVGHRRSYNGSAEVDEWASVGRDAESVLLNRLGLWEEENMQ